MLLQQVPHASFPSSQLPRGLHEAVTQRSAMAELKMTLSSYSRHLAPQRTNREKQKDEERQRAIESVENDKH